MWRLRRVPSKAYLRRVLRSLRTRLLDLINMRLVLRLQPSVPAEGPAPGDGSSADAEGSSIPTDAVEAVAAASLEAFSEQVLGVSGGGSSAEQSGLNKLWAIEESTRRAAARLREAEARHSPTGAEQVAVSFILIFLGRPVVQCC